MAKVTFGEYAGFTTKNQIRYMKNGRLTSEKLIPSEVVAFIKKKLEPQIARQVEAQKAPEQTPDIEPITEDQLAEKLDEQDFDDGPEETPEETPHAPEEEERQPNNVDPNFLETVSVHTAELETVVQALYERFGIYTVYLGEMPRSDEINPLTGEPFTKYHLGVAYQAAIRANNSGILNRSPEEGRQAIDAGREAHENHRENFVPLPKTLGEAKAQDSFSYRTSVRGGSGYGQQSSKGEIISVQDEKGDWHSARDQSPNGMRTVQPDGRFDFDEPLAEPPTRGKKIIRPDW